MAAALGERLDRMAGWPCSPATELEKPPMGLHVLRSPKEG